MENKKYYSVPYISNSTLTWFKVSPKYCRKRMSLEIVDEEKSYTYLGKQIHMNLLEPAEFEKHYTYLDFKTPTSKQQLAFCESVIKQMKQIELIKEVALIEAYKENYAVEKMTDAAILKAAEKIFNQNLDYIEYLAIKGDYREVLSKSKYELITTITQSIQHHKKAKLFIIPELSNTEREIYSEMPIYWDYPIVSAGEPLKCKSLIDRLVVDHINKRITIVDLKTTSSLGDLPEMISSRNYYRQLAFYRLAVQSSSLMPKDYEIETYIVSVCTQDPYECKVFKMSDIEYAKQVLEINKLMQKISWHWFTNQWDYSREYYEGDGTENLEDEYSNQSIEGVEYNRGDEIRTADALF